MDRAKQSKAKKREKRKEERVLKTYVYFDSYKNRLHLFRRSEKFLPVGTIIESNEGKLKIRLWAPIILSYLQASHKNEIIIVAKSTALSRENGAEIKRV